MEKSISKHCLVSENVYELIKTYVFETSGTFHKGSIKETVEAATRFYISVRRKERQNTNTQTQSVNKITNDTPHVSNTIIRNRDRIVAYLESGEYPNCDLLKKYEQVRSVVTLDHLRKAISFTIGSDDRTIKKWLRTFRQAQIIREVGTNAFEFAPFFDDLVPKHEDDKSLGEGLSTGIDIDSENTTELELEQIIQGVRDRQKQKEKEEQIEQEANGVLQTMM